MMTQRSKYKGSGTESETKKLEIFHGDLAMARAYVQKAQSAKDRGIDFQLSFNRYRTLRRTKKCWYTGAALEGRGPNAKSLERIDSSLPYTDENTVACRRDINTAKAQLTAADIIKMANKLKKFLIKQNK